MPVGYPKQFQDDRDPCGLGLSKEKIEEYLSNDHLPIPSTDEREGYNGSDHWNYWHFGLSDYLALKKVCERHGLSIDGSVILELGGATGRVIRHIIANHKVKPYIAELNEIHIEWLRRYTKIIAFQNNVSQHLPFEDRSVDIVMAFSVFTHIDYQAEMLILEIRRILKIGGIAYITYHSEETWKRRNGTPLANLLAGYEGYNDFDEMTDDRKVYRKSNDPYACQIFYRSNYIKNYWGSLYSKYEILEGYHGTHAVAVLVK